MFQHLAGIQSNTVDKWHTPATQATTKYHFIFTRRVDKHSMDSGYTIQACVHSSEDSFWWVLTF